MSHLKLTNTSLLFIALVWAVTLTPGCTSNKPEIVSDIDGNTYSTVKIGNQLWMGENLKVTHFRNGEAIPQITDNVLWCSAENAAYCYYNNDSANRNRYGALYNLYVVNDSRNIAPEGWHIPSFAEIEELMAFLGGELVAGGKLKKSGSDEWLYPNILATNKSGFTALPGGYRFTNSASAENTGGTFHTLGSNGYWWTSTQSFELYTWSARLHFGFANVDREMRNKTFGFSIRCIKDK